MTSQRFHDQRRYQRLGLRGPRSGRASPRRSRRPSCSTALVRCSRARVGNPALEPSSAINAVRLLFAGGRHPAGYGSRRGGGHPCHRRRCRRHEDPRRGHRPREPDRAKDRASHAGLLGGSAHPGGRGHRERAARAGNRRPRVRDPGDDRPAPGARRLRSEHPPRGLRPARMDAAALRASCGDGQRRQRGCVRGSVNRRGPREPLPRDADAGDGSRWRAHPGRAPVPRSRRRGCRARPHRGRARRPAVSGRVHRPGAPGVARVRNGCREDRARALRRGRERAHPRGGGAGGQRRRGGGARPHGAHPRQCDRLPGEHLQPRGGGDRRRIRGCR